MIHAELIQNQEISLLASMQELHEEADEALRIQRSGGDIPAHLALLVAIEITLYFERLALATTTRVFTFSA